MRLLLRLLLQPSQTHLWVRLPGFTRASVDTKLHGIGVATKVVEEKVCAYVEGACVPVYVFDSGRFCRPVAHKSYACPPLITNRCGVTTAPAPAYHPPLLG